MLNPKKYLQVLPKMPQKYNIAIVGQRQSGKKTIAKQLSDLYGWKVVNPVQIVS